MFSEKSFLNSLKSIDVYRKLPKEYLQPSFLGAIFSIVSISLIIILFISEFRAFLDLKVTSEMLVDTQNDSETLLVNIDVVMHKLPCSLISLDVQDIMGSHLMNIDSTLKKNKLNKDGQIINAIVNHPNPQYDIIKEEVIRQEGCQVQGTFSVLRIPGNFHISTNTQANILGRLIAEGIYKLDLSHSINHISFGNENDLKKIKSSFNVGLLNPLDGTSKPNQAGKKMIFEYYLNVIPTTYVDLQGNTYNCHQISVNTNEIQANMIVPSVFFRYDLSPMLIKYVQTRERMNEFFIECCAIIGGIYTVTSMILSFIVNSSAMFLKNKEK